MAAEFSFDVVSEVNLQEVDNAVNQVVKELKTRYDFKGSKSSIEFKREDGKILLLADDDMKMNSLEQMLKEKLSKRNVAVKALKFGTPEKALDGMIRIEAELIQGLPQEKSKEIVRIIKDLKIKVQSSIQGEKVRVASKEKDMLQAVIHTLKEQVKDVPLQFVNYR